MQDVSPNSPASKAGLIAEEDYIVATDAILNDRDDLFARPEAAVTRHTRCSYVLVEKSNMRPLKLYVYNSASEDCREVQIIPNRSWGGDGRFGCNKRCCPFH